MDAADGTQRARPSAVALIVAAGSGERLGAGIPKAFVTLAGRPLVEHSLRALRASGAVAEIVLAAPPEALAATPAAASADAASPAELLAALAERYAPLRAVPGGATRSESVRAALAAAGPSDAVLVHDAARPLARPQLFAELLDALAGWDAAVAAAPAADTIKEADGVAVRATLDRSRLWIVQTPQAFRRDALERALAQPPEALAAATDDAALVERAGGRVRVVESSAPNLKVTTPADLRLAELLLAD